VSVQLDLFEDRIVPFAEALARLRAIREAIAALGCVSEKTDQKARWQSRSIDKIFPCKVYDGVALFVKEFGVEFMIVARDVEEIEHLAAITLPLLDVDRKGVLPVSVGPKQS